MDFKRIQLFLLAFFILFDIYLAKMLSDKIDSTQIALVKPDISIEQQLTERNISYKDILKGEANALPIIKVKKQTDLVDLQSQLVGQALQYSEGVLMSTFNMPLALPISIDANTTGLTEVDIATLKEQLLSKPDVFINGSHYSHVTYNPVTRIITARMTAYNNVVIADGTAELKMMLDENFQLTHYMQTYQSDFVALDEPIQLITDKDAVSLLNKQLDTSLPDGATVEQMSLKYYRSMNTSMFEIYAPMWVIVYSSSDTTQNTNYIDAVQNKLLTQIKLD